MEPITLAVVALTIVASKATEKVGEKLGEGAIAAAQNLLSVFRRRYPKTETMKWLEAAPANADLDGSDDPTVIDVEIIEEVKRIAERDPEVQAAVEKTVEAMQQQFGTVVNQTKLAEKIGILIQGGYNPIKIDKFEV